MQGKCTPDNDMCTRNKRAVTLKNKTNVGSKKYESTKKISCQNKNR